MLMLHSEWGGLNSSLRKRFEVSASSFTLAISVRKGIIFRLALPPLRVLVCAARPFDSITICMPPLWAYTTLSRVGSQIRP